MARPRFLFFLGLYYEKLIKGLSRLFRLVKVNVETTRQRPRPIKNELYGIVWRCSEWPRQLQWPMPMGFKPILSVWVSVSVNTPLGHRIQDDHCHEGLFTRTVTVTVKLLTLCQWKQTVFLQNGFCTHFLKKRPVSIGTMIKFDGDV